MCLSHVASIPGNARKEELGVNVSPRQLSIELIIWSELNKNKLI